MTAPSEEQQAEYNKFVGFYEELHECVDSLATEYNSIFRMGGPFTWTDEMALDCREAITIVEDLKAKLHKVFLVNAIEQATIDKGLWEKELSDYPEERLAEIEDFYQSDKENGMFS